MVDSAQIGDCKAAFRAVVLSFGSALRFTQDSPVLPDVWMAFVDSMHAAVPLILVPHYRTRTTELADQLRRNLNGLATMQEAVGRLPDDDTLWEAFDPGSDGSAKAGAQGFSRIVALSNDISVALTYDEMIDIAMPLTEWWQTVRADAISDISSKVSQAVKEFNEAGDQVDRARQALVKAFRSSDHKEIWRFFAVAGLVEYALARFPINDAVTAREAIAARWMCIGKISKFLLIIGDPVQDDAAIVAQIPDDYSAFLEIADRLLAEFAARKPKPKTDEAKGSASGRKPGTQTVRNKQSTRLGRDPIAIWRINLNRPISTVVWESRRTVKADAAARVFEHDMTGLAWAIVDSGVDATHIAFQNRVNSEEFKRLRGKLHGKTGTAEGGSGPESASEFRMNLSCTSRVAATYDFNRLKSFMAGEANSLLSENDSVGTEIVERLSAEAAGKKRMPRAKAIIAYLFLRTRFKHLIGKGDGKEPALIVDDDVMKEVGDLLDDIKRRVLIGREIDWRLVEPILLIPHDRTYKPPLNPHGTHVAGTLCGDLRRGDLKPGKTEDPNDDEDEDPQIDIQGVCPTLWILDLRVCDDAGGGEEFVVLSALQFIAYLNRDRDKMRVQGVNLSLSLRHDVMHFACGRTPICLECERLTENGVVVVAAAGNRGFSSIVTAGGNIESYQTMTITDPGNAEGVITVGATHRRDPHAYGVSYFSSRGPTGDGRQKPDLVAPGENITAPVPGGRIEPMDGTSMAAPHVSGAAAALMARYPELIRRPARVKEILCATATDLGRERRFQGAGLVNILRALQAV